MGAEILFWECQVIEIVTYPQLQVVIMVIIKKILVLIWASLVAQLGEGNGNPSSILAWRIPWSLACYSPWGHKRQTRLSD